MTSVWISIGSNLGESKVNCLRAIAALPDYGVIPVKVSSTYETEPWGMKNQPAFINMALEAETELGPHELLKVLKDIEKLLGRVGSERWGPRVIDLDILLYGDLVIKEQELEIPHPLMHEREFVLAPLAEVAPDLMHPVLKKTMTELYASLRDE